LALKRAWTRLSDAEKISEHLTDEMLKKEDFCP